MGAEAEPTRQYALPQWLWGVLAVLGAGGSGAFGSSIVAQHVPDATMEPRIAQLEARVMANSEIILRVERSLDRIEIKLDQLVQEQR